MKKHNIPPLLKNLLLYFFNFYRKKIKSVNNIIIKKSRPSKLKLDIYGKNNHIIFEKKCKLGYITIFISGNNNKITISENCNLKKSIFWIEDNNCEIFLDQYTTIESADFAVSENNSKIFIGKDCMFSSDIKLKTGDSHSIIDVESKNRINPAGNIFIGNHCWLGQEVIILKNTRIGDNCVVGVRSILTKSYEANSLIVGTPAKVIKEKIDWKRERI
jgi:acetyltransferase-like isoleucine patch superfamily enzyme